VKSGWWLGHQRGAVVKTDNNGNLLPGYNHKYEENIFNYMKKKKKIFMMSAWILLLPMLLSCSSAAWYASIQAQQRKACLDVPTTEYADCMERANRSFESYRRDRAERYGIP